MHLLVDAQVLQTPETRHRGVGRYARSLLEALARDRPYWRVDAVLNDTLPAPRPFDAGITVVPFRPLLPPDPAARDANERYFGDWITARRPDVFLELSVFEDHMFVPIFTRVRPLLVHVAYDLIPLVFHEHYLSGDRTRTLYARRFQQFARADLLLAISEATRRDVIDLMRWPEDRVVAILGAPDPASAHAAPPSPERLAHVRRRFAIDRPFLLYVGGIDWRKNLDGALAAFAALPPATREAHLLVIVGALTAPKVADLQRLAVALGIERHLRLTGFVDDDVLQTLYHACRVSLFPSHYEGLGLPVLEALSAGAPVVASSGSGTPEFAGPVSRLADPASPAAIAAAIAATLDEPRDAQIDARRRFASGFTWTATAARAAAAIAGASRRRHLERRRPRIAWVSPLPPVRSQAADCAARLLPGLRQAFEIELVVSPEAVLDPSLARGLTVLRPSEVGVRHEEHPFDLFVHHLEDSDQHLYMLDLLDRHPGMIVLHDRSLSDLALCAHDEDAWPGGLAAALDRDGAPELADAVQRGEVDRARLVRDGRFSTRFIEAGDGVIVHSVAMWQAIRASTTVPVFCIGIDDATWPGPGEVARAYATALRLTIARRTRLDGDWRDQACAALADAAGHLGVDEGIFERWAHARAAATAARSATR